MRVFQTLRLALVPAAHATFDVSSLFSLARAALIDTITSLQGSEGGVIGASEVYELITDIHDILDNAVPKWIGNAVSLTP